MSIRHLDKDFLPKKIHGENPYGKEVHKVIHHIFEIEIPYRPELFEDPPQDNIIYAFVGFYNSELKQSNKFQRKEWEPRHVELDIPKDKPRITIGLDRSKLFLYFRYKKEDHESRNIVKDFIKILKKH